MLKHTCLCAVLLLSGILASGQRAFLNFYGTSDSDYGNVVVSDNDGSGYLLVMQSSYNGYLLPVLVKSDCNGIIEWTEGLRMADNTLTSCHHLINVPGKGYLALLSYQESGTGNGVTAAVMIDHAGNILWSRTLPLMVSQSNGCATLSSSGIVVCGNPYNTPSAYPGLALVSLDLFGNLLDQAIVSMPGFCTPIGITCQANGHYAVAGIYPSSISGFTDIFLLTVDAHLDPIKAKVYNTFYDDDVYDIDSDNQNNIYLCGRSYFMATNYDAFLMKFDSQLEPVFIQNYDAGTAQGEIFRNMLVTKTGDLAMCGDIGAFDERDPVLVIANTNGDLIYRKKYPVSPMFTNYFFSLAEKSDRGFALTGDIRPVFSERDAGLLKTDYAGEDYCYSQSFAMTELTQPYTLQDTPVIRLPFTSFTTDSLPVLENVVLHQVLECNEQTPCPEFNFVVYDECPDSQCANFYDMSGSGSSWSWKFEGAIPAASTERNPQGICYARDGKYKVELTVSNGISSSVIEKEIEISTQCFPVFPNIITPDNNNLNDKFVIGQLPRSYELKIFDRWGILLETFTEDSEKKWWTAYDKNGNKVPTGVYYYTFVNRISGKTYNGFVQVSY